MATVVSFFFDLGKLEGNGKRRSASNYKETSEKFLRRDMNLFFFGEKDIIEYVREIRTKHGLIDKTFLMEYNLIESSYLEHLPLLREVYDKRGLNGYIGCSRMTPHYFVCIWTKFIAMRIAIKLNPFDSQKFCWIDYGIFHISREISDIDFRENLETLPEDKIRIVMLQPLNKADLDREKFYQKDNYRIAGGIWGGGKDIILTFCDLFDKELLVSINLKLPTNEENIIAIICIENQGLFDFTNGYYSTCLIDFSVIRSEYNRQMESAIETRKNDLLWVTYSICLKLLNSSKRNILKLTPDQIYKIYDELIISSFYTIGKRGYREIVKEFLEFCSKEKLTLTKLTTRNIGF